MRRSPMPKRRKPLRRTGRLRPKSGARRAADRKRRDVVRLLVEERGPGCQAAGLLPVDCQGTACDPHEMVRRGQGGSITDPDNILLLCRICHQWVTEHPKHAVELGLAKWGMRRGAST